MGPATWSDSWGAPRFAGGYHPHHGQDILCRYGAPILAVQGGIVRFGADPLGGREAFLERKDGSYWYYAHLKSYATGLASGDRVKTGRIIGRCGASGDATVPHVHFALFTAEHVAVDPMRALISWLRGAQKSLPGMRHHEKPRSVPALILPTPREPVNLAGTTLYAEGTVGSAGAGSHLTPTTRHGRGRRDDALLSDRGWARPSSQATSAGTKPGGAVARHLVACQRCPVAGP